MLSERITALFTLLQCSNTDIARYAGCSSGNISKLKTGNRTPKPESRSISVLLDGVYRYADYENMLTDLKDLCGSSDTSRGDLIPHLHAWLFETDDIVLPAMTSTPKSKKDHVLRKQRFGDRLNRILTLLNISNAQFGALLNIDVSLVSRYRSGIYSPHRNEKLSDKISEVIVNRAVKTGKEKGQMRKDRNRKK